jgi:NUDIX domain
MIVFIDDRPLRLLGVKHVSPALFVDYDQRIDARLEILRADALNGHVLILNAIPATAERLIDLLYSTDTANLLSVTLLADDHQAVEERIKSLFKLVKAAGGVVFKQDQMLLMFRRGVWDLPKGKLDPGERSREAALREVEEETGVRAELGEKICTTWHTYLHNGNRVLKRTKWYRMMCLDDSQMAPQAEEGISELGWMTHSEAKIALTNSFSSIRYVFDEVMK